MGCAIAIIGALILCIAIGAVPGFLKMFVVCMTIGIAIYALIFFINEKIIQRKEKKQR